MITVNDNSSYYNLPIKQREKTDNTTANTDETLNIPKKIAQNTSRITPELVKKATVDSLVCIQDAGWWGLFGEHTTLYLKDGTNNYNGIELAKSSKNDSKQRCQEVLNDFKNKNANPVSLSESDRHKIIMNVQALTGETGKTLTIEGGKNGGQVILTVNGRQVTTRTSATQ